MLVRGILTRKGVTDKNIQLGITGTEFTGNSTCRQPSKGSTTRVFFLFHDVISWPGNVATA